MFSGNSSSNPYLPGPMLIYWIRAEVVPFPNYGTTRSVASLPLGQERCKLTENCQGDPEKF